MDVEPNLSESQIISLSRRLDRPVVLVGMMGVGKTSLGKKLAAILDLPFADADHEIELAAKMTIPEMFETYDEAYFRDGERRVIGRLVDEAPRVIATGGGAFSNPITRNLILNKAIAVWLDAEIDTLLARVSRRDNRPLLQQGNPRETLIRLKAERETDYAQAPIHVISGNGPQGQTVNAVLRAIDRWL